MDDSYLIINNINKYLKSNKYPISKVLDNYNFIDNLYILIKNNITLYYIIYINKELELHRNPHNYLYYFELKYKTYSCKDIVDNFILLISKINFFYLSLITNKLNDKNYFNDNMNIFEEVINRLSSNKNNDSVKFIKNVIIFIYYSQIFRYNKIYKIDKPIILLHIKWFYENEYINIINYNDGSLDNNYVNNYYGLLNSYKNNHIIYDMWWDNELTNTKVEIINEILSYTNISYIRFLWFSICYRAIKLKYII